VPLARKNVSARMVVLVKFMVVVDVVVVRLEKKKCFECVFRDFNFMRGTMWRMRLAISRCYLFVCIECL